MTTLDIANAKINQLITHHVGNKLRDEQFVLSKEVSLIADGTQEHLFNYFFMPMKLEEFFCFSHAVKLSLNEVYTLAEEMFNDPDLFIEASQSLAKLLYQQSSHPKVKEGELNVVHFSNVELDGKRMDAIGIFKSESNVPYLQMEAGKGKFSIRHDFGFEIKGMDKGCIIFNTDKANGYRILIVDHANRFGEAQYWKDDFLQVQPVKNEFHQTNQFLSIAKTYVTKKLDEDFEVSKADKIDLLNRSVEYFKSNEQFDQKEFEAEVFQDSNMIKSFRNFDSAFREENKIEVAESFEISPQAVKKQARVFKSVLKLDKNFHIYIHGNRELIEQGVEKDGRKYYKIYFQEEK